MGLVLEIFKEFYVLGINVFKKKKKEDFLGIEKFSVLFSLVCSILMLLV